MHFKCRFRSVTLLFLAVLLGLSELAAVRALASEESSGADASEAAESNDAPASEDWMQQVDHYFGKYVVTPIGNVLFYDFGSPRWLRPNVPQKATCGNDECGQTVIIAEEWPHGKVPIVFPCPNCGTELETGTSVPLVVFWLFAGAIFFTVRMAFINVRGFWHAIRVTRGDYDNPDDAGEVSHFQALASALSATVGLGNIAGVAIAVGNGGPGAIFWMILAGVLGMSSKFTECTLGQMYRKVAPDGTVSGGPMHYLYAGLKDLRICGIALTPLGATLSVLFAIVCMGGSFGGGCTFQVSQSLGPIRDQVTFLQGREWVYGVVMVLMVAVVIIGGIRRIAATAERIVPLMCGVYVATALYILLANFGKIDDAFGAIFSQAFSPDAMYGGFLGVMVIGIKRAAFSNEAGIGSAAIAHAAAKTDEPVSEGIVALLEPFIDTVVICTMTGLVIVVTGVYDQGNPVYQDLIAAENGAALTSLALESTVWWFPWILCVAVFLFAYSTMISWSYYGERCWSHLFGSRTAIVYRLLFLGFVMLGSVVTASNVKEFSDLMILSMAFPNILGVVLLSGKVRRRLDDYWSRYKAGELDRD